MAHMLPQPIKKHRRKLPKRSIVDADLVSSKTTDSARIMDDLLLPSEHDRIILSEIFDNNTEKEPLHASLLPRVVIGVPNNKRKISTRTNGNKSYKERLYSASHQDFLDLSGHSIIPPSSKLSKEKENEQRKKEEEEEEENDAVIVNTRPEVTHDTVPAESVIPDCDNDNVITEAVTPNCDNTTTDCDNTTTDCDNTTLDCDNGSTRSESLIPDCDNSSKVAIATTYRDTTPDDDHVQLIDDDITCLDTISIDTHQYEQECYVEIQCYAAECMSNNENNSSQEEEEDAVKNKPEQVESPIIPAAAESTISQAIIIKTSDDDDDSSETWMELDDNSSQESTMSEKIYKLMNIKVPPAVPTVTTLPAWTTINKHVKLKRLKEKKTLDWIENMSITNKLKMVDKKSRQIALKRQKRLALKRQRPYVIRKRIKSIIWTQNTE